MRIVLIYVATDKQEHFCRHIYLFDQHIQSSNDDMIIKGAATYVLVDFATAAS